jgi:alpha-D-xyloside xylohydrolase
MKIRLALVAVVFAVVPALYGRAAQPYEKLPDGVVITVATGKMKISWLAPRIIHVFFSPDGLFPGLPSLVVKDRPAEDVVWTLEDDGKNLGLASDELQVRVSRDSGAMAFCNLEGETVLSAPGPGPKSARRARVAGEEVWQVAQAFDFVPGEALYGLGQFQNGFMNYRGRRLVLVQANTVAVNPFLLSTRGYGLLWDNYSKTVFDDSAAGKAGASTGRFWSEVADGIDYYFILGPELDRVIAGYRAITGQAPMYPRWAYGYFQSKERYQSFDELIEVVKEYRRRQIPIDTIVQDWMYWGGLGWNPLRFDESGPFRDPAKRIREIHDLNAHIIISIWPNVTDRSEVHAELAAGGHLLKPAPLTMEVFDRSHIYDAYSPEARVIYWKHLKKNIFDLGLDGFWMDATEPETGLTWTPGISEHAIKGLKKCELGTMARYLNTYSLMATSAVYEGQRESGSDKRVYILTRSTFAGQQRYAATTWSGDIMGRWPVLKNQIAGGLNFCLAGVPYWTTDIGGFFTEKNLLARTDRNEDPAYRELYVRWFQYGAFCPVFRSHGTNTPREVWSFGEPGDETYDALVKFDNLRYRLMPYIYSLAWRVTSEGYTIMRGLAMDFRADARVHDIADQFMFGPALLINPVTEPIKRMESPSREVYLPRAEGWFDFWTGETMEPGKTTNAPAPLSIIPIYVRAGSIIPMGPFIQYAAEKSDPIELRVYPGADGSFTLYEDENDNYDYERGVYAVIPFSWDESSKTLTIGERKGSFPGMARTRTINVVIVSAGRGAGVEITAEPDRTVTYNGKSLILDFSPSRSDKGGAGRPAPGDGGLN